ncbi:hypothetical protein PC129_g16392 [Phytophthora cactorum]|uniref:Uncharacterized protein n=2 Tax=Phytophthora cactorum TaxID=29920 RepID=A0A8T1BXY5_9STRA|nr:hypothetical protein PC111_g20978 [Phytophthora cactorum]KAG2897059.1 hypothetical protein PC115_g17332 [Phytophthora cactorum]KAG2899814.1 hypothetical protein PC114_g13769 [Phytophthora cactorum]KAG2912095.1 hypothetical protein PC117_g18982 [Phytophthora cactorum]KAG3212656.1 hypothetical protein PC129_g16392 [Phytophthora cactorum]
MTVPSRMEGARPARSRRRSILVLLATVVAVCQAEQESCIKRRRLIWNVHKQTFLLEGQFKRCYSMNVESFRRLLMLIRPSLARDTLQSTQRITTDPSTPENMVQMTITWLTGGSYHTICCLGGTSVSGIYDVFHDVMNTIWDCPKLRIQSPVEPEQRVRDLADSFAKISTDRDFEWMRWLQRWMAVPNQSPECK